MLHSGAFDKIFEGVSLAAAAVASGYSVRMLLTFFALHKLAKGDFDKIEEEGLRRAAASLNLEPPSKMLEAARVLGDLKIYACPTSMNLMSVTARELEGKVDDVVGLVTFLRESDSASLIFI